MTPEIYKAIKRMAVTIFVTCVAAFTIMGIVAIWVDVGRDVIGKSFMSLIIVSIGLFFVVGAGYARLSMNNKPVPANPSVNPQSHGTNSKMPLLLVIVLWGVGILFAFQVLTFFSRIFFYGLMR